MGTSVDFKSWLVVKLRELNTDETVFGSYIEGILDCDETSEEKSEALRGILAEIVENGVEIGQICEEILIKWQSLKAEAPPPPISNVNIDEKLAKLMERELPTAKQKQYTEEEKKIREAILSQYGQMTDSEDEEQVEGTSKESDLEKNVNAQLVADAEKLKREQARADCQKKKEKDKEDREKQKNLKEEKKEKRKTQKGERRR
ncbi:coiled-coil domain-containing protein 43 [Cylas formicarius]|uniref:coiled-coil domain-containing protein 43 n=1 Tax=Cylas formicarius TaxID=197179 RepID=UPI002958CA66|nr:coiled-coil domain-containing protein 43 [Cylas formicarius]